jgi:hypothetical protein
MKSDDTVLRPPKDHRVVEQFDRQWLFCDIARPRDRVPTMMKNIVGLISW